MLRNEGLSKAKKTSAGGSDTPMSPAGNNRCLQLGVPTGAYPHTMELLAVQWNRDLDIVSSDIVQGIFEEI